MANVFDLTREDLVIRKFFDDPIIQSRICAHMDKTLFNEDANSYICMCINGYYKKHNKYPSAQELIASIPKSTQRTKLMDICNADIPPIERDTALYLVESFFREKKTEKVLMSAAESIHTNNFENIADLVKDLQDAVNFNLKVDLGLDMVKDAEVALERLNKSMVAIPAAIGDIRAFTASSIGHGGHYRKALTIYLGMPNVGKSIILCNDAAFAYRSGYNVLYVTMELAEEIIWERIASNVSDIMLNEIRGKQASEIQELLLNRKFDFAPEHGNLFVKSMPTTSTVVDLENAIIEIKRVNNIDIDMLVVDYIGIMKPAKRESSFKDHSLYTMGKEVAEQLRDMGKARCIAVVTASQLTRDGYENKDASMKNTAGSAGLNDTADLMITITQDAMMKQNKMYYHMILKNRFGPNSVGFFSKVDYSHMRVTEASSTDISQYSSMQISQDQTIPSFNNGDELRGSSDIAIKSNKPEKNGKPVKLTASQKKKKEEEELKKQQELDERKAILESKNNDANDLLDGF